MCRSSYLFVVFAAVASGAGCGFEGAGVDDGPGPDPAPNPGGTVPRCKFDFVDVCGETPTDALRFSQSRTIDTSVDGNCQLVIAQAAGAPELCVFYAKSIIVDAGVTVRGVGSRALAFVSQGNLTMQGIVRVNSSAAGNGQDESLGAGAEIATCPAFGRAVVSDGQGGSGGAGGAAAGSGGGGGDNAESLVATPRLGGLTASAIATATVLRGGCRGQKGGDNGTTDTGGGGGPGGGALLLAAHGTITIAANGRVTAGGGAGSGASTYAGGGGGGSGGMLVFEGAAIANSGVVTATGGGGGQGGYVFNTMQFSGSRGDDGRLDGNRADGGGFNIQPGQGGDGSGSDSANGNGGAVSYDGAGGGGGGAGWIIVRGTRSGAGMWVPAPST